MFPKGTFLTKDDPLQTNPDKPTVAKKDGGLLRSSGVVSFFTMLSRVMGLARDVVLARVIGAEAFADVFFVAFKIPNFLDDYLPKGPLLKRLCLFWANTERKALRRQ